jgi:hypothetical protein
VKDAQQTPSSLYFVQSRVVVLQPQKVTSVRPHMVICVSSLSTVGNCPPLGTLKYILLVSIVNLGFRDAEWLIGSSCTR